MSNYEADRPIFGQGAVMKQLPIEPSSKSENFERRGLGPRLGDGKTPEIVFDDQPLEAILYGQDGGGPTPATLFGRARELVGFVRDYYRAGGTEAVIDQCKLLAGHDISISSGLGFELAAVLTTIIPQYPNPVLRFNLAPLRPLLEKIWAMALENENNTLRQRIAAPFYRCCEHYGDYKKARQVLRWLLERNRYNGDQLDEAVTLNNHAFEYLLEGRFQEALPEFEQAANLFQALANPAQSANSRANYWICKFESSELDATDQVEAELKSLAEILTQARYWQARKPIILLGRVAERRGDLEEAILWAQKAVEACKGSGTRYAETDEQYLQQLKLGLQ